jgi:5-methyltetrahydrofolate--homocysteine methyltransferase
MSFDWDGVDIPDAPFIGDRTIEEIPLTELVNFIDWTFFFTSWDIPRRFPSVLEDEKYGEAARALFKDAESMLGEILENGLLTARAKYGFWKANSEGDDIVVFDEDGESVLLRLNMLRQQQDRGGSDYACLSDFIAPMDSGREDHIGMFAVTAGIGADELANRFQEEGDDYRAIMASLLADRLAEAAAEWLHKKIRGEWGFPDPENLSMGDILNEKYRSIRPAYGYPACPDHSEMRKTFRLLNAKEIGMRVSENNAIIPAAGVSGLYFAHPESRYFSVGRVAKDQIADYGERKGISIQEAESLLFANLGYFEKD